MSLLSHDELVELVDQGVITNTPLERVGPSSIDVTLGKTFLFENIECICKYRKPSQEKFIELGKPETIKDAFVKADLSAAIPGTVEILQPQRFVLGCTEQEFNLPNDISAEFKLVSSLGRIGLNHTLACWMDAGWHGSVLTLELHNALQFHDIVLKPGMRIGQVVFFRHAPVLAKDSYATRGRYNNDKTVSGAK